MKKLLSLLLILLLLTGCAATYDGPTEEALVLGETVQTHYFPETGTESYILRTVYAYDIYGNQVQQHEYAGDELTRKTTKVCDAAGNVLSECLEWKGDWLWEEIFYIKTSYDSQNRPATQSIRSDSDITHYTWIYDDINHTQTLTYDGTAVFSQFREDGFLLLEEKTFDDTVIRTEYTLRDDGQPETIQVWKNGTQTKRVEYRYDDQGRPIRHTVTGERDYETTWEYAEHQKTTHQYDGTTIVTKHHPDGRIHSEDSYTAEGSLNSHTEYIYRTIQIPVKEVSP